MLLIDHLFVSHFALTVGQFQVVSKGTNVHNFDIDPRNRRFKSVIGISLYQYYLLDSVPSQRPSLENSLICSSVRTVKMGGL